MVYTGVDVSVLNEFSFEQITGYDLLHGFCNVVCDSLLLFLQSHCIRGKRARLLYPGGRKVHGDSFIHEYVVVRDGIRQGVDAYVDVRGVFEDKSVFLDEFFTYEREKHGYDLSMGSIGEEFLSKWEDYDIKDNQSFYSVDETKAATLFEQMLYNGNIPLLPLIIS